MSARRRPRSRRLGSCGSGGGGGGRGGGVATDADPSVCRARRPSSSRWQLAALSRGGGVAVLRGRRCDGVAAVRRDDLGGRPEESEEDGEEHEAVEEAEDDERGEDEEEISEIYNGKIIREEPGEKRINVTGGRSERDGTGRQLVSYFPRQKQEMSQIVVVRFVSES